MPHPFHWQPGDGLRHATLQARPRGGYTDETRIETLCGTSITVDDSEHAWLWTTCSECNKVAHVLAGIQ